MSDEPDFEDRLRIGYTHDYKWEAKQRADQRIVWFTVVFHKATTPSEDSGYPQHLHNIWFEFLQQPGLCANIGYCEWHPDHGFSPKVNGWIWRQRGEEELLSITEEELFHLSGLLQENESVRAFALTEQITTAEFGKHQNKRKLKLRKGDFIIEDPDETV